MTPDPAAQAADPNTSHAELYELVRARPDLRPVVAENPSTYPALLEWLDGLGDPEVDAALARRRGTGLEQPTAVLPVESRSEFDQQVFGSTAGYAATQQPAYAYDDSNAPYTHEGVYDPEEDAAPRRRRGGAGVLVFLLALLTVGALAATYFLLMGNPFENDDAPAAGDPPVESVEEEDAEGPEEAPAPEDDAEESPAPEDDGEEEEGQQDNETDFERPAPDDALSITEFSSPTGNITCQLNEGDVLCSLANFEFDAPEDCDNRVTFRVSDAGSATIDCSSSVASPGQQLQYGEVTGNEDFACEANEFFFECWSQRTGEGFEIAREYYEFTGN